MNIRTRLALQFVLLASCILAVSFAVIYLRASEFRKDEFRTRLRDRGENAANLLIQVDEVDELLLRKIELRNPVRLVEEGISILDAKGAVLFHTGVDHPTNPLAILDQIIKNGKVIMDINDRELYGFRFENDNESFVVIASGFDRYGRRKLTDEAQVMLLTFLIGLILIFLVGRSFARRALSPVQRLIDELHHISATDLSKRIDSGNGTDELAQLALSFNELLARLQSAFLSQKNFIANASHEMRTPLTAISGQIDVLLLKQRNEETYLKALRSVQEDLRTVNRLSDRLLLMAQAETEATALTFSPVRMDELIWMARQDLLKLSPDAKLDVIINDVEDPDDLTVNGNESLLLSMITNLVENACKYSPDHHAIVTLSGSHDMISIEVLDNGPGIAPEDHDRIFEHFYRAKNTGGAKGHGIGLALVKRIVELHGGNISLRSNIGEGAGFTVQLQPVLH